MIAAEEGGVQVPACQRGKGVMVLMWIRVDVSQRQHGCVRRS